MKTHSELLKTYHVRTGTPNLGHLVRNLDHGPKGDCWFSICGCYLLSQPVRGQDVKLCQTCLDEAERLETQD